MEIFAIVGGSSGIGLALVKKHMSLDKHVVIIDRNRPDATARLDKTKYTFIQTDLISFDESLFNDLVNDKNIEGLNITAGFGRVTDFENISVKEINDMMAVNATACIKIISLFYDRIRSNDPFYTAVMGSIAGLVSSPMFSVYAASKAAVCRFIESVNIELEVKGTPNRILNVSPGSIKGTKFNGGENDLSQTEELASEIIDRMYKHETLFIPKYEETFKGVIERYQKDPHEYGLHSYEYKLNSGRVR